MIEICKHGKSVENPCVECDEEKGERQSELSPAPGSAEERAILINAVEWLALEVIHHGDKCTCGSCHAVAACADIIEAKNSKYIANTIRRQLAAKNPPNEKAEP